MDFYRGIHRGCTAGRIRRAGIVALIVHDIKLTGNPLGDRHADIEIVFVDGVPYDGAEYRALPPPAIVHDTNRAAQQISGIRGRDRLACRAWQCLIVPALPVITGRTRARERQEGDTEQWER